MNVVQPVRFSPGLLVAGFLVLGSLFVWSPVGRSAGLVWPWEQATQSGELTVLVGVVLWAAIGVWTVLASLVPGAGHRSLPLVALAAVALLSSSSGPGPFEIRESRPFVWMAGVSVLGAGLVLARRGDTTRLARAVLLVGAIAVAAWFLTTFDPKGPGRIESLVGEVGEVFQKRLRPEHQGLDYILGHLAGQLGVALVAGGALLYACGLRARTFALVLMILLVTALLLPGAARLGQSLQGGFEWADVRRVATSDVGQVLVLDGLALWALLVFAVADLVGARGEVA